MSRSTTRFKGSMASDVQRKSSPTMAATEIERGSDLPVQKKRKVSTPSAAKVDASGRLTTKKMPEEWRGIKGKRGQLKEFVDMPVDILLEVFSHLSVPDLYTLASSSKALRALLYNRSMCFILWKVAFSRLQPAPPPCPEDVTFPQYASFLFSRVCFTCDKKTGLSRSFECLCVFCKECLLTEFINLRGGEEVESLPLSITPRYHIKRPERGRGSWEPFRADYERHKNDLANFDNNQQKLAYVEAEQAKVEERKGNMNKFYTWYFGQKSMKTQDQRERRSSREEVIMERLRELGYGDVLQKLDRNDRYTWMKRRQPEKTALLKGFASVKPLTDKEWTKIRPMLVARLDLLRKEQEEQDRQNLIRTRTNVLKTFYQRFLKENPELGPFAPPVQQLAKLEPFKIAIYDTAESEEDNVTEIFDCFQLYAPAIEAWKACADEALCKILPLDLSTPDVTQLTLAKSAFRCTSCDSHRIFYPEALTHPCLYGPRDDPGDWFSEDDAEDDFDGSWDFNEGPSQLEYDPSAIRSLQPVAKAYEADVATVTYQELDAEGSVLQCTRCPSHRICEDWREAVNHEALCHSEEEPLDTEVVKWLRHPPDQLPALKAQQLKDAASAFAEFFWMLRDDF